MTKSLSIAIVVVLAIGCGAGGPRSTRDVRSLLDSEESATARQRAPELIEQVREAIALADGAEERGDLTAAADHATRARLLLEAAQAEAARIADEEERRTLDAQSSTVLEQARRDERARDEITTELARLDGARAAQEEALRALAEAETDEARGPRRVRVSLEEAADIRRAASALRSRARLLASAARALGAADTALAGMNAAVTESEQAREPMAILDAADRAQHLALRALGDARRAIDAPGEDAGRALAEEARSQGFEPVALAEGMSVEADRIFAGTAAAIDRRAGDRIARLASIAAAHPHGPVLVQVQTPQAGRAGEQLAARRAESMRRALTAAGVSAERLASADALGSALQAEVPIDRVRLVFPAYATP